MMSQSQPVDFGPGRPVVFRNATVLTMDPSSGVLRDGDVLVTDQRIAAVGTGLAVPDGTAEIDASGGILMPGMVDTHRHMWQTALRGFGADWTLTNYFHFYYLNWGKIFRPQDIYAGNLLSAIEAIDAGVTTTVDWSHGLQTVDHAEAAVDALQEVPGRFVLAYGNLLGDPSFPEQGAFESALELGLTVTTHAGVWGDTNNDGIRLMSEHGFMTDKVIYVHAATLSEDSYQRIAASGGHTSISTESEQSAGQGYPPTWKLRRHNIPVSLSNDTSVWWSADLFSAMRATLSADRVREHLEAHNKQETVVGHPLRAEQVVAYATTGGAAALGMSDIIGSITPSKKADLVLIKNDRSPVMFPLLHPYGHVVYQAGRGDVHTVMVNGKIVKYAHAQMGDEAWNQAMNPDIPKVDLIPNPYTYSDWKQ